MNVTKYILFIFCWIRMIPLIIAQPIPVVHDYTLGIKDGLLANYFIDVLQDSRGIIWMASAQGINRYDGIEIKSLSSKGSDFANN